MEMIELTSKWEKDRMGETLYFCKKHKDTKIKFVEMTQEGSIRNFHYFCDKCEKERREK